MYYIYYGLSRPSLLMESTDSMYYYGIQERTLQGNQVHNMMLDVTLRRLPQRNATLGQTWILSLRCVIASGSKKIWLRTDYFACPKLNATQRDVLHLVVNPPLLIVQLTCNHDETYWHAQQLCFCTIYLVHGLYEALEVFLSTTTVGKYTLLLHPIGHFKEITTCNV